MVGAKSVTTCFLMARIRSTCHRNNGARTEKIAQAVEEGTLLQVIVVLGSEFLGGYNKLNSHQLITFALKSTNNL